MFMSSLLLSFLPHVHPAVILDGKSRSQPTILKTPTAAQKAPVPAPASTAGNEPRRVTLTTLSEMIREERQTEVVSNDSTSKKEAKPTIAVNNTKEKRNDTEAIKKTSTIPDRVKHFLAGLSLSSLMQ